jgi:hypothetical protein
MGQFDVDTFIARWQGLTGGQERANYGLFLSELCDVLGVARPDPSGDVETNDYVLERVVKETARDGSVSSKRIDLYKRDCFVLEAKQSRQTGGTKEIAGHKDQSRADPTPLGQRTATRAWDVLMLNARRQAEDYVRLLPKDHAPPPFVIVCDVGHCLELYANFRRDGKAYDQFPDRNGFRIFLEDLRDPAIRARLATIFDAQAVGSLDPTAQSAKVTREIAGRLAAVSKALEQVQDDKGRPLYPAPDVAAFLSRCLFTMFAEDVGLLPERSFRDLLERCEAQPDRFTHRLTALWEKMDTGGYSDGIDAVVRRFNGKFFKDRAALPLGREEIGELKAAASANWREVEPAIFGTLLESALDPDERKRLGAHYTPRAYVERLVQATIIEPLRADWEQVKQTAEIAHAEALVLSTANPDRDKLFRQARETISAFHARLAETRVLDPACGTGNFLYVALELMKRLEGEVLEALESLGGQAGGAFLERATVDPHTFFGLEVNPRAAAITELVLWIGYLQWHFRNATTAPPEPILKDFANIRVMDAVLQADVTLQRDEAGKPVVVNGVEQYEYRNPRRPDWPMAEFIVGNPPWIGAKYLRERLGDAYTQALWAANGLNESADFVMYWWDRAADLLTRKGTVLRRFGLVTTNSISQVFQRRVMEKHLNAKKPVSLLMAIADHPWTKATKDAAAVRMAMTVVEAGSREGVLWEVTREAALDTDTPIVEVRPARGTINSDLTVGVDVTKATALLANEGICSPGVKLHGAGFIVTPSEAQHLGLGRRPGLEAHIRPYRNGRDLTSHARGVMVIDLFGLSANEVRDRFPEVYQHVSLNVKPERDANNRATYRDNWWIFGEPRRELRPALVGLRRYIVTPVTQSHRTILFLDNRFLADDALMVIASDDAFILGCVQSSFFLSWFSVSGSTLEDRPRFIKSRCFDPFPFPEASHAQKTRIRTIAEALDAHRKDVLSRHPHLTLTGLYNVLEKLRVPAGTGPDNPALADILATLSDDERRIFDDGLVLILKEHHDALDAAVAEAYGWPLTLTDDAILARLVALNAARAKEEAAGHVRWLRPDYQAPRFGKGTARAEQIEADLVAVGADTQKPLFPKDPLEQTFAVTAALAGCGGPVDAATLAATFRQGQKVKDRIAAILLAGLRTGALASPDRGLTFALRKVA